MTNSSVLASIADVGSSGNNKAGERYNALASAINCCCPHFYFFTKNDFQIAFLLLK